MTQAGQRNFADVWPAALLLAASTFVICFRLGSYSLVNGDEAVYHAIAQQMVASGDWFTLDFKGEHRVWDTVMNAPIQYWARALILSLFGDGLIAVRILSALCGVAGVLMTYRLVLHLTNRETAFLASAIQITTFQFVYLHSARTGELDTAISLLLTASAYLFIRALESGRSFVLHHLCLILMLNLKTPTVAIPLIAELACLGLLPACRARFRDWLLCSLWMLPLGLLWHFSQLLVLWDPIFGVVEKMGEKAAGDAGVLVRLASNTEHYGARILFGAFPYSLALPVAAFFVLRDADDKAWRVRAVALFGAAVLAFYLPLAERNSWYMIPIYPFASALIAIWLFKLSSRPASLAVVVCTAAVASLALWLEVGATSFNPFAEQANRIAMETNWRAIGMSTPVAALGSAAVLAGAILFLQRRMPTSASKVVALALATLLLGIGSTRVLSAFAHLGHQSEMAQLRTRIDAANAAGTPLRLPINVGEPLGGRASFYFADDFELVPVRSRSRLPQPIFFRLEAKSIQAN